MNDDLMAKTFAYLLDMQLRRFVGWLHSLPATFVRQLRAAPAFCRASLDAHRKTKLLGVFAMDRGISPDELARRQGYADCRDFSRQTREMFLIRLRDPSLGLDR